MHDTVVHGYGAISIYTRVVNEFSRAGSSLQRSSAKKSVDVKKSLSTAGRLFRWRYFQPLPLLVKLFQHSLLLQALKEATLKKRTRNAWNHQLRGVQRGQTSQLVDIIVTDRVEPDSTNQLPSFQLSSSWIGQLRRSRPSMVALIIMGGLALCMGSTVAIVSYPPLFCSSGMPMP